ncbi:MAG: hypothetical protein ACYDH1_01475 [Anaerolineaceae bacterium]
MFDLFLFACIIPLGVAQSTEDDHDWGSNRLRPYFRKIVLADWQIHQDGKSPIHAGG